MNKGLIVTYVVIVVILLTMFKIIGVVNHEIVLRNHYDAHVNEVETTYDTMWKTIAQKHDISDEYRETFIDGLKAVAAGREGGGLFKSNTEANSQLGLSTAVFQDVMTTIEGKRDQLKRSQDTLTDIWREHKSFCQVFPNSIFVGGKVMPRPTMISSSRTKSAIDSKLDDDIEL